MQNIDFTILKENIRMLMKKENMTQTKLADILDMAQSDVSKCLQKDNDSRRFTLEQACKLAMHFDITLDELVGLKREGRKKTAEEICRFFKELIRSYKVIHFDHEVEEEVYTPINNGYDYDIIKKTVTYDAFYFPNYITPPKYFDEFRLDDLRDEIRINGNDLPENMSINNFLQKFIDAFEKYDSGTYDEDDYNILVEAYFKLLRK